VPDGSPLPRFLVLYGALFAAFGVVAPFLPGLLLQDGLSPGGIGIVLAAGTATRLLAGPLGGRLADRTGRAPLVLTGFIAVAAIVATGYVPARGVLLLLVVSVAHAAVLAPVVPIADALTLGSATLGSAGCKPTFEYGWVRAMGSAAFIAGALLSGSVVGWLGLGIVIWLNAGLLGVAAGLGWRIPNRVAGAAATPAESGSIRALLGIPVFRRLMVVAALIGGSHALHDSFEVIRWRAAGLTAGQCSVLWTSSVAAEIVVFLVLGRRLLHRLGPAHALSLAALAGVVRWGVAAQTAWFPAMAMVEPLHGLTFALLHLACLDLMGRVVPAALAATAQAFYGTVAMGAAAAAVTLASGPLYEQFGPGAFWAMAALCAAALPVASGLRVPPIGSGAARSSPG